MKKISSSKYILLSVLGMGLLFSGCKKDESTTPTITVNKGEPINAVVHKKVQVPIIYKSTGELCYYCGAWGWQAWIDLADAFTGRALTWSNYSSGISNSYFRNQELSKTNSTMEAIKNNFYVSGGKPNFYTNGKNHNTSAGNAKNAAETSISSSVDKILSSASISGSWFGDTLLKVTAGVKFYKEATGEYYIGAYIIENKAIGPQAGPAGAKGNVEHHFVMRGSMANSPWGEKLEGAGFKANTTMEKSFSAKIPSNYKKENINIGVIIWKKNGSKYEYINAATNLKK